MKYADCLKNTNALKDKIGTVIEIDNQKYVITNVFPIPRSEETRGVFLNAYTQNGQKIASELFMTKDVGVGYSAFPIHGEVHIFGDWEI